MSSDACRTLDWHISGYAITLRYETLFHIPAFRSGAEVIGDGPVQQVVDEPFSTIVKFPGSHSEFGPKHRHADLSSFSQLAQVG